jgi:hypothetical protein
MSLDKIFEFFCSLKLAVWVLCLSLVLVFLGTLAQEPLGLYLTQDRFFHSFFVDYASMAAAVKKMLQMISIYVPPSTAEQVMAAPRIPVFPGGYGLGFVFLLNLIASQIKTFEISWNKLALQAAHVGLILLLVGQLLTDLLATESTMHIREGGSKNYSEIDRVVELALVDVSNPDFDRVTAIPGDVLASEREIAHGSLPFKIRVNKFYPNSTVTRRDPNGAIQPPATQGVGPQVNVQEVAPETQMDRRDMPSVAVELVSPEGSLGTWFASLWVDQDQAVTVGGKEYHLSLRPKRLYKPYRIELIDFRHEQYPGTQIPKDFSSMVRVHNAATGEERETRIYMNNPLRYGGETYYQASYDKDDQGTVLQVVRNPSWLTPYLACVVVSLGLLGQFIVHLVAFFGRRRSA